MLALLMKRLCDVALAPSRLPARCGRYKMQRVSFAYMRRNNTMSLVPGGDSSASPQNDTADGRFRLVVDFCVAGFGNNPNLNLMK